MTRCHAFRGLPRSVDSTEPLDPTEEIKIDQFKNWLKKRMRHIKLPQLLIEVDAEGFVCDSTANEFHFTRHFLPLGQSQTRPVDEIVRIIAALMFASLSSLHKTVNYKRCALAPLVNRKDRIIKMDWIVDQWDHMGQFYATLKTGHTTASVALKRLNSMSKSNQFYRAGAHRRSAAP